MKKSRFSETQIINILKEGELLSVEEICRKHNIVRSTFYTWKSRYGGMDASQLKKLKELEEENRRLKSMYAQVSMEKTILQEALEGKL